MTPDSRPITFLAGVAVGLVIGFGLGGMFVLAVVNLP